MALLSMHHVTISLGGKPLLEDADFSLEAGERVCVAGRNGAGKSTFLSLLAGTIQPDKGEIVRTGLPFGHMPQNVPESWRGTVFSLVAAALGDEGKALAAAHAALTAETDRAEDALTAETDRAEDALSSDVRRLLEHGGGWEGHGRVMEVVNRLALDPGADFATLSGGGKRRVALGRALLRSEDLILDEPTNHLDLTTIAWLEDFLLRRARTLVFVSHDRAFARKLATRMAEIDRGRLYSYACGFDMFGRRREERLEAEERHFAEFDRKLAREEVWIRQGIKARRTRNMGRVRALEAMRAERARRRERQGNARMAAQEAERSGKLVIEADSVSFGYPGRPPLFTDFSTVIQRGDRVGLIGANGAGKSTLLRVLLGELAPDSGTIRHGTHLQISYFDQLRETLDPNATVMHSVAGGNDVVTIGNNTRHVAGYLQDFLFTPDRLRLPVSVLSGGERNRLLLAKLFTKPSNVLVLDEPTNDLDAETLELLEELLAEYSGTVLLVSHDREFLDNLVTSVLALEGDGKVREYVGAYTDWLRQRPDPAAEKSRKPKEDGERPESPRPARRKLSYNEQREVEMLAEELAELPGRLEKLEHEQHGLEEKLADPGLFARDPEAFSRVTARLAALEDEQTALLERWEAAEARHAELSAVGRE